MYNKNSGYGQHVQSHPFLGGGQVYIVGKSGVAGIDVAKEIFKTFNGKVRYAATLNAAIDQCVASQGDKIYVMPGHTETISTATALAIDIAGVTITGIGNGTLRPTYTLDTATTATIAVSVANITIENIIFVANFAAIVSPFTLTTAKDFTLRKCEFRDTSAILNFVNIIDTNATSNDADGLTIEECKRIGAGATTDTTIVKMDGTNDRLTIKNSYFAHLATTAAGLMIIAAGKVVTNAIIDNNVINLLGAAALTTGIIITTDGTTNSGIISRNFIQSLDVTTEILVTASSGFIFSQNYYSGAADKSGYLLPAADA